MKLIEWINGVTKLSKATMDKFQNNVKEAFDEFSVIPIGVGFDYFGETAPEDFLFADGSEISRTDYAELFAIIGETYGAGDGETTFNLPDKRECVSIMKGENDTLGDVVGNNEVSLTTENIPKVDLGNVVTKVTANKANDFNRTLNNTAVASVTVENTSLSFGSDTPTAIDNRQRSLVCNYIIKVK